MLILIHLQSEERCKSQEPYGSHLQRRKRCVKFLTPLAPNEIKFTSKAGHSFGASKMRAGTCSQHSMGIPVSCKVLQAWLRAQGTASPLCHLQGRKHNPNAHRTCFNKLLNLSLSCLNAHELLEQCVQWGVIACFLWGCPFGARKEVRGERMSPSVSLEVKFLRFNAMD